MLSSKNCRTPKYSPFFHELELLFHRYIPDKYLGFNIHHLVFHSRLKLHPIFLAIHKLLRFISGYLKVCLWLLGFLQRKSFLNCFHILIVYVGKFPDHSMFDTEVIRYQEIFVFVPVGIVRGTVRLIDTSQIFCRPSQCYEKGRSNQC
jgi:hypothetical protein